MAQLRQVWFDNMKILLNQRRGKARKGHPQKRGRQPRLRGGGKETTPWLDWSHTFAAFELTAHDGSYKTIQYKLNPRESEFSADAPYNESKNYRYWQIKDLRGELRTLTQALDQMGEECFNYTSETNEATLTNDATGFNEVLNNNWHSRRNEKGASGGPLTWSVPNASLPKEKWFHTLISSGANNPQEYAGELQFGLANYNPGESIIMKWRAAFHCKIRFSDYAPVVASPSELRKEAAELLKRANAREQGLLLKRISDLPPQPPDEEEKVGPLFVRPDIKDPMYEGIMVCDLSDDDPHALTSTYRVYNDGGGNQMLCSFDKYVEDSDETHPRKLYKLYLGGDPPPWEADPDGGWMTFHCSSGVHAGKKCLYWDKINRRWWAFANMDPATETYWLTCAEQTITPGEGPYPTYIDMVKNIAVGFVHCGGTEGTSLKKDESKKSLFEDVKEDYAVPPDRPGLVSGALRRLRGGGPLAINPCLNHQLFESDRECGPEGQVCEWLPDEPSDEES
jgi:hypothetical protein